jgi:hypothetical protein
VLSDVQGCPGRLSKLKSGSKSKRIVRRIYVDGHRHRRRHPFPNPAGKPAGHDDAGAGPSGSERRQPTCAGVPDDGFFAPGPDNGLLMGLRGSGASLRQDREKHPRAHKPVPLTDPARIIQLQAR